jgi:hypothetical protein
MAARQFAKKNVVVMLGIAKQAMASGVEWIR